MGKREVTKLRDTDDSDWEDNREDPDWRENYGAVVHQAVNVDFNKKPGKIRVTSLEESYVYCRVHYLEELDYDKADNLYCFGLIYPDSFDPVTDDAPCVVCEENEAEGNLPPLS